MTIRVLIADDQDIIRSGLTTILNGQPDIEVVGQAVDGREAVELAQRLRPDVCLFDIRMPNIDGIEATRLLAGPEVEDPFAVVVITTFDTDAYVTGALRAGAKGFLLKDAGPQLLVQAIHAADPLMDYVQDLVAATRTGRWFLQGLSPRAGIAVVRAAKAHALLSGRDYVAPDDVQAIFPQTVAHRMIPVGDAGRGPVEQVRAMLEAVPLP